LKRLDANEDRYDLNARRFLCGGGWANKFPLVLREQSFGEHIDRKYF